MRTTLDIDDPILKQLKDFQARDGRSLGRLVSDLLAQALSAAEVIEGAPQHASASAFLRDCVHRSPPCRPSETSTRCSPCPTA
jgi:hypothetical protein